MSMPLKPGTLSPADRIPRSVAATNEATLGLCAFLDRSLRTRKVIGCANGTGIACLTHRWTKGEAMKTNWIMAGVLLAALSSRSAPIPAPAPSPVLVCDKDTVAGIGTDRWTGAGPWLDPEFIRVRNASARTVTLDSLRFPSGYIKNPGDSTRLGLLFAVRGHAPEYPVTKYRNESLKYKPIVLAAGDSIDIGLFGIGAIFYPVKTSAAPGPRRYQPGDSITARLALFAGADSIAFILKATVRNILDGSGGMAVLIERRSSPAKKGRTVTLDGRAASPARPVARILFR
jgi:hypothetical protein